MKQSEIVTESIQTEQYHGSTISEYQGAVVIFTDHVHGWTRGIKAEYLEYEVYIPMTKRKLTRTGDEINERRFRMTTNIARRIGLLQISDVAVLTAVSSPHRKNVYRIDEYAVECIREIVPIWKKEAWEDGSRWQGHQKENYEETKREE